MLLKEILTLVQLRHGGDVIIASIGGFDLKYRGWRTGDDRYDDRTALRRTGVDDDIYLAVTLTPLGAVSRLEHAISDFEDALERCHQHLADARRRLAAYQSREGGDFAFASELADKRRQLTYVENALASDIEGAGNAKAIAA